MKIKLFEEYNKDYLAFNDEYLSIHKILYGPNKGKIRFLFHDFGDSLIPASYSMMYGCSIILGTKYEKIPQIRQITTEKFKTVATNTMSCIYQKFMENMGYEGIDFTEHERKNLNELKNKFNYRIQEMRTKSNNIGEILDGLKIIQMKFLNI